MMAIREELFEILFDAKTTDEFAKLALFAIQITFWDVGIGFFAHALLHQEQPILVFPLNDTEELLRWTDDIRQMDFGRPLDALPTETVAKAACILYLAHEKKIDEALLALTLLAQQSKKVKKAYKADTLPEFIAIHVFNVVPGRGNVPPIGWQLN